MKKEIISIISIQGNGIVLYGLGVYQSFDISDIKVINHDGELHWSKGIFTQELSRTDEGIEKLRNLGFDVYDVNTRKNDNNKECVELLRKKGYMDEYDVVDCRVIIGEINVELAFELNEDIRFY